MKNFKIASSITKILEKVKPDIVYAPWCWSFCGSAMYACRILGIPFVFCVRGTDIFPPERNFILRVKTAKMIITLSEGYSEILVNEFGVPACKIRVIRPCLGPINFKNIPKARKEISGPLRLLNISTLRPVKRHIDLLKCCKILREEGINFELRICGDGPDREKIRAQIKNFLLEDRIFLMGHLPQEELIEHFKWCDIYVHTSESESFCFAVVEAQASSRPVIAYDAKGGLRQSIINNGTAILVPLGDYRKLAEEIMRLRNNADLREKLASQGRKFVEKEFSFERFSAEFIDALFGKE
jgi:glycosyltransferase involved in cell wall biosynthesis